MPLRVWERAGRLRDACDGSYFNGLPLFTGGKLVYESVYCPEVFCSWALKFHRLRNELMSPIVDTRRRCR